MELASIGTATAGRAAQLSKQFGLDFDAVFSDRTKEYPMGSGARRPLEDLEPRLGEVTQSANHLVTIAEASRSSAEQLPATRSARRNTFVVVAAALPALLFLYAGYFVSLRNALLNAIEARAIEASQAASSAIVVTPPVDDGSELHASKVQPESDEESASVVGFTRRP